METTRPKESRYDGIHCNMSIQELSPAVIVLTISGTDVGEFGHGPMKELGDLIGRSRALESFRPAELFIDARHVRGAAMDVSSDWAKWLTAHKPELRTVHIVTGSRFVQITAEFVRRHADLEGIMQVYTDASQFDAALAQSLKAAS